MDSLETSGKTVEEAVGKALRQLGLEPSQVDVEVVSQGRPGILGFGGEPARVIVTPRSAPAPRATTLPPPRPPRGARPAPVTAPVDATTPVAADVDEGDEAEPAPARPKIVVSDEDAIEAAVEILEHLLDLMGVDADVEARPPETPGDGEGMVTAVLDVLGDDLGALIGRRGETLVSLQYLLNLMLARRLGTRVMMGVDVGGYRRRREESLRSLAERVADRVRATGQSVTLEPMPPNERRIVHIALSEHPDVLTVSIGEGDARKVAITPKR